MAILNNLNYWNLNYVDTTNNKSLRIETVKVISVSRKKWFLKAGYIQVLWANINEKTTTIQKYIKMDWPAKISKTKEVDNFKIIKNPYGIGQNHLYNSGYRFKEMILSNK